jgi:hypothetical protein
MELLGTSILKAESDVAVGKRTMGKERNTEPEKKKTLQIQPLEEKEQ